MKNYFPYLSILVLTIFTFYWSDAAVQNTKTGIVICTNGQTDLTDILDANHYQYEVYAQPLAAVKAAKRNSGVLFIANDYPAKRVKLDKDVLKIAADKNLKIYVEYPESSSAIPIGDSIIHTQLERGIVSTSTIKGVDSLDLIGIHNASVIQTLQKNNLLIVAKVAGFDKAQYGIADVEPHSLLFQHGNSLIATTRLSNGITSRFGPVDHLKPIWEHIFNWLSPQTEWKFDRWPLQVTPVYGKSDVLSDRSIEQAINKGVQWFYNGRFFVHPSWNGLFLERQGDGSDVAGPPLDQSLPNGDGSLGVLEGHLSRIQADGSQIYRYWMRADCNAEVAYALSTMKDSSNNAEVATNLLDYIFKTSNLRGGNRNDPNSPSYGLVGWSTTHPFVYYGDDNARVILGALGASARLGENQWDQYIAENIIANFRTTGINGFRGERLADDDIMEKGVDFFASRDLIMPHPHFESWMWATYLWLYDKTGYKPLLEQSKKAIAITMESYPKWKWTNGIQQERARMILPLAWLVRVEDTPQHREWLDLIVNKVLENMDESGAIREELGSVADGRYGATKANADYGKREAPLIAENGDPVADMLYTTNFGFFALNEAASATNNPKYKEAVSKIADFLVKIQVQSKEHNDLDGAWFRAFDYNRWEYWASNADAGWGAWGTLTGWTQSWIVSTLKLKQEQKSLWEISKDSKIKDEALKAIETML